MDILVVAQRKQLYADAQWRIPKWSAYRRKYRLTSKHDLQQINTTKKNNALWIIKMHNQFAVHCSGLTVSNNTLLDKHQTILVTLNLYNEHSPWI